MSRYYRSFLEESTVSTPLLLNTYSGATAGYSLRKVSSTYSGNCIRVRRSSDNAEQDFGFVSNALDTTSLTAFVGAGNGFVTTWYDQSGNSRNATQTTATNQPQIVASGNLIIRNSKPYIEATSTMYFTFTELNAAINTDYSLWLTYEKDTAGNQAIMLKNGINYHWLDYSTIQYVSHLDTITISSSHNVNTLYLINTITNYSVGGTQYRNGSSIGTRGSLTSASVSNTFPSVSFRTAKITFSEMIYYPSNQSSNRTGIESNINAYYAIY
jgi:hypothetical protein